MLQVPEKNRADHHQGDARGQIHPGGKEQVPAFLQQQIDEQGRNKQDGGVFGQSGQAEEKAQHEIIPRSFPPPFRRGYGPDRRHQGKDEKEQETVRQQHQAHYVEDEGGVDGHDGQEGHRRRTAEG